MLPKAILSPEEQECEQHFIDTHRRDTDGRFIVALPMKPDRELGASRTMATRRFHGMEKRLQNNETFKEEYTKFMDQYLALGHMEPIPTDEQGETISRTNYLPHHFILKESSTTTSFRVVFDASAKTENGVSLNDTLLVGPKLQDDLWDLLLRFRTYKHAFTADIEKMYRQITVKPDDADLQIILWRVSPEQELQEFRLTTLIYGTASAPFLATRVLKQLAIENGDDFPAAKETLLRDFFMDDLMSGAHDLGKGVETQAQLISLLEKGGFRLRKWSSNCDALLESFPEDYREDVTHLSIDSSDSDRTLGLHWYPRQDHFSFVVTLSEEFLPVTKRRVLSDVSKLFDPLGWIAPVILIGKRMIQDLWVSGVSWDQEVPKNLSDHWNNFREQLPVIQNLNVNRCVVSDQQARHQLHGFCDASETAYGAAIYLRSESADGKVTVNLLCAKTKVAPLKRVTLPRLELCGALLLAKLLKRVQETLTISLEPCLAWTDSSIALSWICSSSHSWKTFVANRVTEIQEMVKPEAWHHVPTKENPADAASRGLLPLEIADNSMWWNGPEWLALQPDYWPISHLESSDQEKTLVEQRTVKVLSVVPTHAWDILSRFSTWTKLKRVVAYCLRFLNNARPTRVRVSGPLSTQELNHSSSVCIKLVQGEAFSETIICLQKGKMIPTQMQVLNPFLDQNGILRVGGRLKHSQLGYDQKHPILLPKNHHVTDIIIRDVHHRLLHAGLQATLATIQQSYWIVNARNVVRNILHKCIKCFRERAEATDQLMADLPSHRVEPSRPFLRCGVDFGGPFMIRNNKGRGGKTTKAYVSLFICFSTKAIHLELVSELSTSAFIAALKRFAARRGKCMDIYSDNATNFVGANKELRELHQQFKSQIHNTTVSDFLTKEGTNWHFMPPSAPHFGGLWEAGIKATKTHLRKIVGTTSLTFEELYTVLTQIEACLNSRPLCPLSSDPNDLQVLTPSHFLVGEPLSAFPEPDITHIQQNRLSRWQLVQRLTQHFWKRWQGEYLAKLQQRPKWRRTSSNLDIGTLILVKEDKVPPLHWCIGRIIQLHPGKDGIIRVVTIKTSKGNYKRPIVKVCPLPIS